MKITSPTSVIFHSNTYFPARQLDEDKHIAMLDPLDADSLMKMLPKLNAEKDTVALVLMLVDLLPSLKVFEQFNRFEAAAAMRDLGMLLGSLKRHKVEPVAVIPELEEKLNLLAEKTNLPPRDTLIHYSVWNPTGERERSYTGTDDEHYLIESVRMSMHPLLKAIDALMRLHGAALDENFVESCYEAGNNFESMVKAVVLARKNVNPAYFANELRFYFDPIELNNREYIGPGAVEMPVFVYDHLLWGSECQDLEYTEFKHTYLPFILPEVRTIFHQYEGKRSIISHVCKTLEQDLNYNPIHYFSAKAVMRLCTLLKSFRMPHKKLAESAYAHSGEENRTKGSGGYAPDILDHILRLNLAQIDRLEEAIEKYQNLLFQF